MVTRELKLFADINDGRLVQSFDSTLQAILPGFVFGDSVPIAFRALQSSVNSSLPWDDVDLTGQTVRIAIGTPAGPSTAGAFTLTYGANTTAAIAYDATGAQIATALNLLASIISAGGVTVTRAATGAFRIIFDDVGARADFTIDASSVYPSCGGDMRTAMVGDSTTRAVITGRIETLPAAYAELTADFPTAAAVITLVRAGVTGVTSALQTLRFDVPPHGGTYLLNVSTFQTAAIQWNATTDELESALEVLTPGESDLITVTGEFPSYSIEFDKSLGAIDAMTSDVTGLIVPTGRKGTLETNTAAMIELLNGSAQATAKLEIELYTISTGKTWTILQTDCTVIDDVIPNSPGTITGGPVYLTIESLAGSTTPILRPAALGSPNTPYELRVTGVVIPSGNDPVILQNSGTPFSGYLVWHLTDSQGDGYWDVFWDTGKWKIRHHNGEFSDYIAVKTSSAPTPIGLTDWDLSYNSDPEHAGQPLVSDMLVATVGQECIVGTTSPVSYKYFPDSSWHLMGPSGVKEDNENPGLFRKDKFVGGAYSSEPYTPAD